MPQSALATGLYGRVLDEALSAALAPAQRNRVLEEALELAGLDAIPPRPTAMRVFLEGALFTTLARHLTVEDALELVKQARSALDLALGEEVPRSDIRKRPVVRAAIPSTVLIASQASLVVYLMQDVLQDRAPVITALRADEVREAIRKRVGEPLLVVVDRRHPCAGGDLTEHIKMLGKDSTVIWWSASLSERLGVREKLAGTVRLIERDTDARLGDLGDLCRQILDGDSSVA